MESTDDHWDSCRAQRAREIERARILVRLHTDQRNKAECPVPPKPGQNLAEVDARVRLVDDREVEVDLRSQHRTVRRITRDAMDDGERIRRDECPHPLNDVSV